MKTLAACIITILMLLSTSYPQDSTAGIKYRIRNDTLIIDSRVDYMTLNDLIGQHLQITALYAYGDIQDSLPENIRLLKQLTTLDIGGNQLAELPKWLTELPNLRHVDLGNTVGLDFRQAFAVLSQCTGVEELDLYGVDFRQHADGIQLMTHLKMLDLQYNHLEMLPGAISEIRTLTEIALDNNPDLDLKQVFEILSALPMLERISAFNDSLTVIPPNVGALPNLRALILDGNMLTTIPLEICSLSNLEWLGLAGNELDSIPTCLYSMPNLKLLVLAGNHFDSLQIQGIRAAFPKTLVEHQY